MFIVIFASIVALFFSYLDSIHKMKNGMLWGFVLVTVLAMIHYDYGNDYMEYYAFHKSVTRYESISSILDNSIHRDVGWSIINYLFQYLGGFFVLVATISFFEGWAFYHTIKMYLPRKLWWFGVFLYLFSTSFYLLNFSMLRQGLVVAVFLSLFQLIANRKWWIVAPILYLSSFVHASAFILIPFAFWGYLPLKNRKVIALIFVIVLTLLYISSELLNQIQVLAFESSDMFENYEIYGENDKRLQVGVGFILYLIPLIVSVFYLIRQPLSDIEKMIVVFFLISAFFTPVSQKLALAGRVGFYFAVARVIAIPLAYKSIKNNMLRMALILLLLIVYMYDYYSFYNSDVFAPHYTTFNTIFSVI